MEIPRPPQPPPLPGAFGLPDAQGHCGAPLRRPGFRRLLSPWFRYNLAHDPGETLAGVRCPILALIGEKDRQVPPEGNIDALRRALEGGGHADSTVDAFPGVNHFFQTAPTGSPREYRTTEETFSPTALERIASWIGEIPGPPDPHIPA